MFTKFVSWFIPSKSTELEAYILSKNPQTVADVEHLAEEFVWARGL